jgi:O-acetyl-ADP-ribose deacetylase (regulator of RNase III)
MELKVGNARIVLKQGDITREKVDAIVNAANSSLLGGGGVDGAIHRVGGPDILAESSKLGGCAPGDAKVTGAGKLEAKWVVHTVGPIWNGGQAGEDATLASAYRRSLEEAKARGARSVSFPSISTGAYGFPLDRAAGIALKAVRDFLAGDDTIATVNMVLWSSHDLATYGRALAALGGQ